MAGDSGVAAAPPEGAAGGGRAAGAGRGNARLPPGPARFGDLLFEVDNPQARNVMWGPTLERLRARWDWTKLPRGSTSERGLAQMPAIPGIHIRIVPRERMAVIYDPLGQKGYERLLAEVANVHKQIWGQACCPVPPVERRGMSDNDIATWLYWAWREVEAGHVRRVSGEAYDLRDIAEAMPKARIQRQFYDSLAYQRSDTESEVSAVAEEYDGSAGLARQQQGAPGPA